MRYGIEHDTSMLYSTVLLVSNHRNHHRVTLLQNLTFRRPCIMIYSYNKTNDMHYFLKFIFEIEFYILVFKLLPCSKCNLFLFWAIPRRLSCNCRRFGTHCRFHLHRQVNSPAYEDGTDSELRNVDN